MDDRAVVMKICPTCHGSGINPKPKEVSPTPQPRAIVALSDDRQWLVTQEPPYRWRSKLPAVECFYIWRRCGSMMSFHDVIEDTGQDAHQVLAAWMATHEK